MELSLRIYEAYPTDVGRSLVRIHKNMLKLLGLTIGDIIEIRGRKKTSGIVHILTEKNAKENIVRVDGTTRTNLKAGIGDIVIIKKVEEKTAKTVVVAPFYSLVKPDITQKYIKEKLLNFPVCKGDIFNIRVGINKQIKFKVVETSPSDIVVIRNSTKLIISAKVDGEVNRIPYVTYEDIGGFKKPLKKIREMIELPLKYPEFFNKLGIDAPKGVLLYGPPGCGKTLLAQAVANESNAYFISINGPEIMSKYYGESEKRLREIFNEAEKNSPSIIFIDELDAIAPRREDTRGEVERRVVAQLLTLMDGIKSRGKIIVIGATNRLNAIDPALRRPGRFDREVEIIVPDSKGRLEILQIHTRNMSLDKSVDLNKIAEITYGFVGADLAALCREAGMRALQRLLSDENNLDITYPSNKLLKKGVVKQDDFLEALKEINPSALREIYIERPKENWSRIGGLSEAKRKILEIVNLTLNESEAFNELGVSSYKGILLYGPPGVGKTVLIRGLANEINSNFIEVKAPDLLSKWAGETEKAIEEIFRKAKMASPCIIFFDDLDIFSSPKIMSSIPSNELTSKLINEIDKLEPYQKIILLAATNKPDVLDPALIRPGRFDFILPIFPPDQEEREEIFKIYTSKMNLESKIDLTELAKLTNGFTGADIHALCRETAIFSLKDSPKRKIIKKEHFEKALKTIRPTLSKDIIEQYKKFEYEFRNLGKVDQMHII
ncbi:MAG: CDC48 family AAA ATPase [Candidatus Odinarchaeia archaeon]